MDIANLRETTWHGACRVRFATSQAWGVMSQAGLELVKVTKRYGATTAVDAISFVIAVGGAAFLALANSARKAGRCCKWANEPSISKGNEGLALL
jgi:hypothetical protein